MRCQSVADVLREGWFPQFGSCSSSFFFNDTATTEIYTLSLHDALPIYQNVALPLPPLALWRQRRTLRRLKGVISGSEAATALVRGLGPALAVAVMPQLGGDAPTTPEDGDHDGLAIGFERRLLPVEGLDTLLP